MKKAETVNPVFLLDEIEKMLNEGMKEYDFNPVTTSADARVVGFPMPGGAIGPNVHMMKEAGILDRYNEVLAEPTPWVEKINGFLIKTSDLVMPWMFALLGLALLADSAVYFYRGTGLWQF